MSEWVSMDSDVFQQYMQNVPIAGTEKKPDAVDVQHFKAQLQSFVLRDYNCLVEWNKGFDN